ncbi:hypothetical protein [Verrucomicrobium sp. BvORR106]|uniref:hypothetical protein n=1 Tax=Verrucomicrobium sp. BvORR106 TaxID=1403819 RepID=UPI0022410013|nr:hypothetical protein [Verrucomicrobium sp. BvORR106]
MLYDPASETLAIRTTSQKMEMLNALAGHLKQQHPWQPVFNVHVVEAEVSFVREILRETAATPFHDAAWAKLETLVEKKEANILGQLRLPTRSGQRVTATSGTEITVPSSAILNANNEARIVPKDEVIGLQMDVEPVLAPDGSFMDVNYALSWHINAPKRRMERVSFADSSPGFGLPMMDTRVASTNTSISIVPGHPRLIGVWEGAPERPGRCQCAFLNSEKMPGHSRLNDALSQLLSEHASPPPPGAPTGSYRMPDDIKLAIHRVPKSFLQLDAQGVDPFASSSNRSAEAKAAQHPDAFAAQRILTAQGIQFPPGSFAFYHPSTSFLIVANRQPNLDMVEAFVSGHSCRYFITLNFDLTIVEGEASVMREFAREAGQSADHSTIWKKMAALPSVKWLESARLETRSGQRASFEAGMIRQSVTSLKSGASKPSEKQGPSAPLTQEKPGKDASTASEDGRTLEYTSLPTGLRWKVDPVMGPAGDTSEVNVAFTYHYAPSTTVQEAAVPVLPVPHLQHHAARIELSTFMAHGTTRWLATWKPTGSPEHEGRDVLQAAFLTLNLLGLEPYPEAP